MRIRNATGDDIGSFVQVYREAYVGLEEYAYRSNREIRGYFKWLIRVLDKTFLTNNYKMATWDENLKKKLLSG